MAQSFPPSPSPSTALALVLPPSTLSAVQPLRSLYDAAAVKWPPHINLFYPFVHPSSLEAVSDYLTEHLHTICNPPFSIRFDRVEVFSGGKKRPSFLVLRPDKQSEEFLQNIYKLLSREFPEVKAAVNKAFRPHCTIGQVHGGNEGKIHHFKRKFEILARSIGEVEVGLAVMQRVDGNMKYVKSWGLEEYEAKMSEECVPGSVIKRDIWTYSNQGEESKWVPVTIEEETKTPGRSLTLSTYNVLFDVDNIDNEDHRWLAICKKLIASNSTIVCLQEVSDDCLSMIGNAWEVRQKYPYISHAPEQPLLRLRNCVILSTVPFTWEEVSSAIQGRSICVAKFDQFGYYTEEKTWRSLVVANVHLPAYHTDEAAKNRAEYTAEVKSYLDSAYPSNPVLIVGDMNMPNEASLQYAVSNLKTISEKAAETYPSLFPSDSYTDAWLVAGEGVDGNTFDPVNNPIALKNMQTSTSLPMEPQRYDRIYLRCHGGENLLIREARVLPDDVPSSDHYLLTSKLSFLDPEKQPSPTTLLPVPETTLTDSDLRDLLTANSCFPSPSETPLRNQAISSLTACLSGSDPALPLRLLPVGSFGLGTFSSSSDTDILALGTISSSLFFRLAKQRIKKWRPTAPQLSIKIVRYVPSTLPMLILLVDDRVRVDLQYTTAPTILSSFSTIHLQPINSSIWNLPIPTLKKLQAYRDLLFLQSRIPNLAIFRLAYRFIKLWAQNRGVYSSKFGYFGGIHISLLLARIAMLLPPTGVTASQLIISFFNEYSNFNWGQDIVTVPSGRTQRYTRTNRDKMVILTVSPPSINVAQNATIHTLHTLTQELQTAASKFSLDAGFGDVVSNFGGCDENDMVVKPCVGEFLEGFGRYIKIDIHFWGSNRQAGRALVGWVESRLVLLLVDLAKNTPGLNARIWPARFHEVPKSGSQDGEFTELRGFYLIGLSPSESSEGMSKEEKRNGEASFAASLRNFEAVVRREGKYDDTTGYVGVTCVKHSELSSPENVVLLDETMIWDGGEADEDSIPSDSEEDEEEEVPEELEGEYTEPDFFSFIKKKPSKPSPSTTPQISSGPTPKLRPSHEVFNRLKWDPSYDAAEYVIGYEDRFRGVLEIGVERWKTEMSDDEFVPMHRVVYFKERKTGEMVWDRERRVDKIFGSGVPE